MAATLLDKAGERNKELLDARKKLVTQEMRTEELEDRLSNRKDDQSALVKGL